MLLSVSIGWSLKAQTASVYAEILIQSERKNFN